MRPVPLPVHLDVPDAAVPRATMYLWMPLPDGIASRDFADRLREEQGVIVLPGSGFGEGGEGFFRISFIQSPERIAEAAARAGTVLRAMTAERGATMATVPAGA